MAYDEILAMRVRDALGGGKHVTEKRMMGGVCFLLKGNMVCGVDRTKAGEGRFMFRIGKDNPAASKLRGVRGLGYRPCLGAHVRSDDARSGIFRGVSAPCAADE